MLTASVLKSRHLALVLITLLGLSSGVAARASVPPGYARAAQALQMPAEIAFIAALASRGVRLDDGCFQPWPWTLTLGSVTRRYPNRAEAHAALLAARHQGVTPIKVGLLQLDGRYAVGSLHEILDPATNLSVGLQALQQRYRQRHDWGVAITTLARRFHRFGVAGFCKPKRRVRAASYPMSSRHGQRRHITTLVGQLASRYTIDPALVLAVIAQESAFNPSALSNKQAQGLMQLIPETAQRFGVRNPFDPEDNIRGGIAYLHFLLRHFQGDVALTLAAYNAGEKAVDKYQGIPPYPETRHYVRRIMAHYPRTVHPVPPPLKS